MPIKPQAKKIYTIVKLLLLKKVKYRQVINKQSLRCLPKWASSTKEEMMYFTATKVIN